LLTLTGTGGTGKTRLALALAANLLDSFMDGIWFVDLSAITDPFLVTPAIAQVLGVREAGQQALLETLKQAVRDRQLLLVLDNFEQVVTAAAEVAELLAVAPGLKLLVTSRTPLHISGEHEFPVPPLGLPDPTQPATSEGLSQYEAVALFIQRAEAARPDFQVTNQNAPAVAEVCARLDGLPLAIELAAARIKLLPPQALLSRLSNRLQLLTGGARDRPARQQTLRGTIDWSYSLLDGGEQVLFRRLAVFVGGCTVEAAEAVCTPDGRPGLDVLEGLGSLVDKSLLQQGTGPDSQPRFRMLETIREYALERLVGSGERDEIHRRHAEHYLVLAEAAEPELRGQHQALWLERLSREHDNLRGALGWALDRGDAELALRLSGPLWRFWEIRHPSEGQRWLERALADSAGVAAAVRAKALNAAGNLAMRRFDDEQAAALHTACLALRRELGDQRGVAASLSNLGVVLWHQGKPAAARTLYEESLAAWRELGDAWSVAVLLNNLANALVDLGDTGAAGAMYDESLGLFRELGDRAYVAGVLNNLGKWAREQGDYARAAALSRESLVLRWELGDRPGVAVSLDNLAVVAQRRGQGQRAARLWGAAEVLREVLGFPLPPEDRAVHQRAVAAARAQLGEEACATAWAEGRALPLEQAIADALAPEAPPAARTGGAAAARPAGPLTRREHEVAVLLAQGLTNRQIAQELVISESTAGIHVEHILAKLGFHSRAQVAAWVAEQGLRSASAD
jgi:non-specific serine/threonine protein kinase